MDQPTSRKKYYLEVQIKPEWNDASFISDLLKHIESSSSQTLRDVFIVNSRRIGCFSVKTKQIADKLIQSFATNNISCRGRKPIAELIQISNTNFQIKLSNINNIITSTEFESWILSLYYQSFHIQLHAPQILHAANKCILAFDTIDAAIDIKQKLQNSLFRGYPLYFSHWHVPRRISYPEIPYIKSTLSPLSSPREQKSHLSPTKIINVDTNKHKLGVVIGLIDSNTSSGLPSLHNTPCSGYSTSAHSTPYGTPYDTGHGPLYLRDPSIPAPPQRPPPSPPRLDPIILTLPILPISQIPAPVPAPPPVHITSPIPTVPAVSPSVHISSPRHSQQQQQQQPISPRFVNNTSNISNISNVSSISTRSVHVSSPRPSQQQQKQQRQKQQHGQSDTSYPKFINNTSNISNISTVSAMSISSDRIINTAEPGVHTNVSNIYPITTEEKRLSNEVNMNYVHSLRAEVEKQKQMIQQLMHDNKAIINELEQQRSSYYHLNTKYHDLYKQYMVLQKINAVLLWTTEDIVGWIIKLENGQFYKYGDHLLYNMKRESINGSMLSKLKRLDLHRLGILDINDQYLLIKHIHSLFK